MAEPETETEDETVTSEFLGEVKTETTDTDITKDVTIESGDEIFTDYESETKTSEIKEEELVDEIP